MNASLGIPLSEDTVDGYSFGVKSREVTTIKLKVLEVILTTLLTSKKFLHIWKNPCTCTMGQISNKASFISIVGMLGFLYCHLCVA